MSQAEQPALEDAPHARLWLGFLAAAVAIGVAYAVLVLTVGPVPKHPIRLASNSVDEFLDAVRALGRRIAAVGLPALFGGLCLSSANILVRSAAWRNIVHASYPASRVRWRDVASAVYAGVGTNAVLPARVGDALRLVLVHRHVDGAAYPTLASSLIAEGLFDLAVGGGLLIWAWQSHFLPAAPALPNLPLFELSWYAAHPWIFAVIAGVTAVAILALQRHVRAFWLRVRQGLAILRQPSRYLTRVVSLQAAGWLCRVAAAYLFLDAFGVHASLRNALLVQVASSLSTLVPATPGGLGPRQALYIVLLAGAASRGDLLAFGVGTGLALAIWNALLGFTCLVLTLRGVGIRDALRHARTRTREAS
jgi:uncharacterized membrane protein YbhN (UPF0104 family)